FQEDADHFLSLIYSTTVYSERADNIISIPDQNINTNFDIPMLGPIPLNDSVSIPYSDNYTFVSPNNERFDSIFLKTCNIVFNINGDINHNAKIKISIPSAKKNGTSFQKTIDYNYSGSVPVIVNSAFSLDGYTIYLVTGNQLAINFVITFYGDGNTDNSPYSINMGESIQSIKFRKIFGYLGQLPFSFKQDSIDIGINSNNILGSITFTSPKLTIKANNGIGVPINITFDLLEAISSNNSVAINCTELNPFHIAAPTFAQTVTSSFELNNTNIHPNIVDALNMSPAPKYINFHANALFNPIGDPAAKNFAIDSSKIALDMELELPLEGKIPIFELQDTVDMDLGKELENLEWILFKISTTNGFPIDATVQVYFADSLNVKLDSLIVPLEQLISSGVVGANGKVVTPTTKATSVRIEKNRLDNLVTTKKLFIYAKLNSANNGATTIRIYSDYTIDVKIGVQAQAKVNF
ncbi:MAG: hypothetical protein HGB12_14060, partial [Bacteroidetes bacterium]|nr:hypothetical protein [Bacteroidota bacterium]